jgi:hypothetical protein
MHISSSFLKQEILTAFHFLKLITSCCETCRLPECEFSRSWNCYILLNVIVRVSFVTQIGADSTDISWQTIKRRRSTMGYSPISKVEYFIRVQRERDKIKYICRLLYTVRLLLGFWEIVYSVFNNSTFFSWKIFTSENLRKVTKNVKICGQFLTSINNGIEVT